MLFTGLPLYIAFEHDGEVSLHEHARGEVQDEVHDVLHLPCLLPYRSPFAIDLEDGTAWINLAWMLARLAIG